MPTAQPGGPARAGAWGAVIAGAAGILLGRIPSFVAALPLTLQSSFDRLTISMMLGAGLFVAGLLEVLIPRDRFRAHLLAALLGLSVGQQFFNANIFRRDWERQQQIYWQFAWRIPALKPDTAILAQQMPLDYETDLAMTAALNWIFATQAVPPRLPYAVVYTEKRLSGVVLPALQAAQPMQLPFRTMTFKGNTSQVIVVYVPPTGCLRVFDPALDDVETYSKFPEALTRAIPLSDVSRIVVDATPAVPPHPPFIAEPAHGWCYIYEKAELARQAGDWARILELFADAGDAGLAPLDPFERLPFIEAEARAGDASVAAQITLQALGEEPRLQRGLCALWMRVAVDGRDNGRAIAPDVLHELGCGD